MGRGRRALLYALLASVLLHLGVLWVLQALPAAPARRLQEPVRFTLIERTAPPPKATPRPPPATPATRPVTQASGHPGASEARASGPPSPAAKADAPVAPPLVPSPSLQAMSEKSAEAVVKQRGPQHAPGDSVGERLAESLQRGNGAMAVQRSGFWDAYFTLLRKALLAAWSHGRPQDRFPERATLHLRLVLDGEGLLRDFDILLSSGSKAMDHEVELALHQTTHFPPPPDNVMNGKTELVTEWEFTVHPGLALAQGQPTFGPFGPTLVFDVITLVNPSVDLTPLELNVVLASYWTR